MRILIAEDDQVLADGLLRTLRASGAVVDHVASGSEADAALLTNNEFDLLILDLGLPRMHGLEVLKKLRGRGSALPVLILTARDATEDRIAGLDAGALQYFVKPVDMQELTAGIRSQLRHKAPRAAEGESLAPWRLDRAAGRLVAPNQQGVDLTSRELELLGCLMATQGVLVTKQALTEAVGADDAEDGFHRIESQLSRLRRKTLDGTGQALPVRAVFGKGLVFVS